MVPWACPQHLLPRSTEGGPARAPKSAERPASVLPPVAAGPQLHPTPRPRPASLAPPTWEVRVPG